MPREDYAFRGEKIFVGGSDQDDRFQTHNFTIQVGLRDANTAAPVLSQKSYLAIVTRDFPVGVPITGLEMAASGQPYSCDASR